jgi:hypothetical protein
MRSVGIESTERRHNPQITCRSACTAHGAIRTCERLRCVGGTVLVQVHGFCVCIWANLTPSILVDDETAEMSVVGSAHSMGCF